MIIDRKFMLNKLLLAKAVKPESVRFAQAEPLPQQDIFIHPPPRLFVVLSGVKHLKYADGQKNLECRLHPGDMVVTRRGGWTIECWDSAHEMISVVFWPEFTRVIYISHDGVVPRPAGPDYFYHTRNPLSPVGGYILEALLAENRGSELAQSLFHALLLLLCGVLAADIEPTGRDQVEYCQLVDILQTNFMFDHSMEELAALAHLEPVRAARLLKKMTGLGLSNYRTQLRMEYAAELLKQPEITVNEISERCGYHYANYFIRAFRQYYAVSPGEFRQSRLT